MVLRFVPDSSADRIKRAGWIAVLASLMTVGLITYGSWVRATGSGLGCPDWPLCHGQVIPDLARDTAIELGHRVYAGITMIVVGIGAGMAWMGRRFDQQTMKLLVGALVLIVCQAILGGLTVLTELHGMVRLAHLFMAMLTLACLSAGALRGIGVQWSREPGVLFTSVTAGLAIGVLLIGGGIVGSGLSAGCPGLPLCDDRSTTLATGLHSAHRTVASILALALIFMSIRITRLRRSGRFAGTRLAVAFMHSATFLVSVQILVGLLYVWNSVRSELVVLHLGLATLLWWSVVSLWVLSIGARGSK